MFFYFNKIKNYFTYQKEIFQVKIRKTLKMKLITIITAFSVLSFTFIKQALM